MNLGDLWRLDATAQAALVRTGEVTPGELLERSIARIEQLNPVINAVITPLLDEARGSISSTAVDAPFAGVPMLVKDASLQIDGTPYFVGTQLLRDLGYRSTYTTELARRLRSAGFVFEGKTNVPALSSGITTEPLAFGATRNPWDLDRTAGGSSGGSAAAVAAGMTSIAHGGDAGGSLRYPAACCGVVTLKPSRGRVPSNTPIGPDDDGLWSEFVLARSVRDLAGVLDAVHGPSKDYAFDFDAPAPTRPYLQEIAGDSAGLRVGLLTHDAMSGMAVDPECVRAVERAGALLESFGHQVAVAHPSALDGVLARIFPALAVIIAASRPPTVSWLEAIAGRPLRDGDVEPGVLPPAYAEVPTREQVIAAQATIDAAIAPITDWWRDHDLLVTPTLRQPAWPLGQTGGALDAGTFPFVFSLTGQPAMSLPLHWTPSGLPVGVQIVGTYGRDDLLLNIAAQLERAAPWAERWPAIAEAMA